MKRYAFGAAVAGVVALTTCVGTPAAQAQDGAQRESDQSESIVLTDPGVVFVSTSVAVDVKLTYSSDSTISGVETVSGSFETDYGTGSGFVVAPEGVVVTASHVVEPEEEELRTYATNMLFFGELAEALEIEPLYEDESPWTRYQISSNQAVTQLLHQCYDEIACTFDVRTTHTVYSGVQLAGASVPKGVPARVLESTGFDGTDVAVLKVDGNGMPTVALGDTAGDLRSGAEVVALGFPGSATQLPQGVTETSKAFGKVSNVRSVGSSREVEVDMRVEGGMSGGPVLDEAGEVVGLVSYTLLRNDSTEAQHYVRSVDDIHAALTRSGVKPSRGEVDGAFAQAMKLFWQQYYSAALPLLQQAINLHGGHPLATKYAAIAQAKAGTSEDRKVPSAASGADGAGLSGLATRFADSMQLVLPFLALGMLGAVGLAALGGGAVLLQRRRSIRRPDPVRAASIEVPVQAPIQAPVQEAPGTVTPDLGASRTAA